jgi:Flp pilus assembly protein CpaB
MAKPRSGRRVNVRIILAGVLVFIAFVGAAEFVSVVNRSYTAVFATHLIPAGAILTADDFQVVPVSGGAAPALPDSATALIDSGSIQDFVGRIAVNTIHTGSPLLYGDFFRPSVDNPVDASPVPGASPVSNPVASQYYVFSFSELLKPEDRAVVIVGDPTSSFVRVGDYVDVFFISPTSVRRLFTKRVIYAIPQPDPSAIGDTNTPTGTAFILELNAQEAQDLIFAQTQGTLRIGLASPDSVNSTGTVVETTPDYFSKTYSVTLPGVPTPQPGPSALPSGGGGGLPLPSPTPGGLPLPSATPTQ